MDQFKLYLQKYSFSVLVIAFGLFLVLASFIGKQNSLFLYGGALVFLIGVFSLLLVMETIKASIQNILAIILLPFALLTAYLNYRSIQEPLEFEKVKKARYAKIKNSLIAIKDAQQAHKGVYNRYASDMDSLMLFLKSDSFQVVKADGFVPDTLTELEALEMGIITRDTIPVSVFDSLSSQFARELGITNMDSLPYIPFTDGEKFPLQAGEIDRSGTKVQVFEAVASNASVFKDWDPHFYQDEKNLQVGSMTEPTTSGNWQ